MKPRTLTKRSTQSFNSMRDDSALCESSGEALFFITVAQSSHCRVLVPHIWMVQKMWQICISNDGPAAFLTTACSQYSSQYSQLLSVFCCYSFQSLVHFFTTFVPCVRHRVTSDDSTDTIHGHFCGSAKHCCHMLSPLILPPSSLSSHSFPAGWLLTWRGCCDSNLVISLDCPRTSKFR